MFCPKCGNKIEQNVNFCGKCGYEFNKGNNTNSLFTPNLVNQEIKDVNDNSEDKLQKNDFNNESEKFSNDQNLNYESNDSRQSINNYNNQNMMSGVNPFNQSIGNNYMQPVKSKKNTGIIFVGVLFFAFVIVLAVFFIKKSNIEVYYNEDEKIYNEDGKINNDDGKTYNNDYQTPTSKGAYQTIIITDNQYEGVKINTTSDAYSLISQDSTSQKSKCPSAIRAVEEEIINNFDITAVNLCEMDIGFAKEISNVLKKVYNEFPGIRGYLTNLTLNNVPGLDGYIAAFMPVFPFANTNTSYPWVIKTQVLLNSSYYLNKDRLKVAVDSSTKAGHFPKNTTIYSPIAHEFGHYISFLIMMKHHYLNSMLIINNSINANLLETVYADFDEGIFSLEMIKEAYNNYIRDTGSSIQLDAWRETISKYAVVRDGNGKYIYDETIAEAFHDVYLNGNNATAASKYIYQVLKSKAGA